MSHPTDLECATLNDLTRRDMLKGGAAAAGVATWVATMGAPGRASAQAPLRPNIIYIVSDDQGWKDVGFNGSDIATPHLDALAKTGVQLEQFYALPMCTPSRATLMTGRYPFRYGLQTGVIPSGGSYGLAMDEWLLSQAMQDAGYRTAMVGKWHLGHARTELWPRQRGFDSYYGPLVGEIDHFKHEAHGVVDWYRDNTLVREPGYDTTLFGREAVKLITDHDVSRPLFLYLAFTAPHTPYQAPQEYLDKYPQIADPLRRAYAAQITAMDDEIGKVVAALDQKGIRENTLVIFHSDNGGTRSSIFAGESEVRGDLPPNNGVYRDGKGTLYEGGTRVCGLANWPGQLPPGKASGLIHIADMYPTLAALAGAKLEKNKPLDGYNMWDHLSGRGESPRQEIVYNIEPFRAAVRQGDYKLVWLPLLPGRIELFDIARDPAEKDNLAESKGNQVETLKQRIEDLASSAVQPLLLAQMVKTTFGAPPSTPKADESPVTATPGPNEATGQDFLSAIERRD
ncbi:arylsulfatase B [Microvirga sp. Mcv34]|uniref:arylsulfatase B n=1 Tax=Microvirga sp. Mcv34 TaxID=2926016 RepID=UPI0021C78291|nr:arylsulfatase [Microvirga sp. Mcv34]